MNVDFGRTAQDYAQHRLGFPPRLFDELAKRGIGQAGQRVLDLGTGTGSLARGFAERGCEVIAIDPSNDLLRAAGKLAEAAGLKIDFREATAERTGLDTDCVDVISAGQCWHWFQRERAAKECVRILRPGGKIVIAHFDWIPVAGNVAAETEALILKHNPDWSYAGGTGLYPQWLVDLVQAGFRDLETFSFDVDTQYTHQAWRGRVRASAGVAASLNSDQVASFDREHAALLTRKFPEDPLHIPHRVWCLVGTLPLAKPGESPSDA